MNRYKLRQQDFPKAILYVKGKAKKGDSPNWAVKFKDDLTVHGKKLKYKGLPIVAEEDVEKYLRKALFDSKSDLPFSRDAAFHVLKKTVVGIPRRRIMTFQRSQRTLGETRAALPAPKVKGGQKLKKYTVETDLVFIRKNDLENINPRFEKMDIKFETYILSSVEKTSGLTKLSYTTTKDKVVVTPLVEEHIKYFAKKLGTTPKMMALRMDKGGEFGIRTLRRLVPDVKTVNTGTSVEARNQMIQRSFYRILKNRRAIKIEDALAQTEKIVNNTLNRIQKKSPNEIIEEKVPEKELVAQYNRTRKSYIKGDKRLPFEVGDSVRIQIKKKKGADIDFKSYKDMTFSARVYTISKRTQGKRVPIKYRVNRIWYTQDKLLKSSVRDKESERIIREKDQEQKRKDDVEEKKRVEEAEKKEREREKQKEKLIKAGVLRRTRRNAPRRGRNRLREQREQGDAMEKELVRQEERLRKRRLGL
jgi:hypothetical protein